ncbi:helix-turn-helix domain-containing protein [Streptomyces sp. NPDC006655]|uniref:helix-turn-helix domain-containing protein n=1 Tax=Streptomyces sp. NPDC006655 TaxID=3156898 RepID=UPI003452EB1C
MSDDRVQSVRNAWTNALRAEVLRVGRRIPEVARVATVGMWIATYADADGSNAFPGRDTLATLAGCSQETVTRAVKVLMGVGVLTRKRRPNASAMYQLLLPLGSKGLDWDSHIHHMTDTRQRKAHAKAKAERIAEVTRTASTDAVENPGDTTPDSVRGRVPDSVRSGGSEPPRPDPDSVRGRPRTASVDAFRTASAAGVYQYSPTSGRDPLPDHTLAGLSPQPPKRAREAVKDESSTGQAGDAAKPRDAALAAVLAREPLARCADPECGIPLPYGATGLCEGCAAYYADHERHSA